MSLCVCNFSLHNINRLQDLIVGPRCWIIQLERSKNGDDGVDEVQCVIGGQRVWVDW